MPTNPEQKFQPGRGENDEPTGWKKWAWFVGLCAGGLIATAALAYGLRALLFLSTN